MLRILLIISVIVSLGYILIKKRKFDFLSIYGISSLFYYYPLILESIFDFKAVNSKLIYYQAEISPLTYVFGIINFCICLTWLVYVDKYKKNNGLVEERNESCRIKSNYTVYFLIFLNVIFILVSITKNWEYLFAENFNKVQLVQHLSIIDSAARYLSIVLFIYPFITKNSGIFQKILGILFIFYTIFMGRRSDFVLSFICIIFHYFVTRQDSNTSLLQALKKYKILAITCFIIAVTIIPFKQSLPYFRKGLVREGLTYTVKVMFDANTYKYSESNSITSYINKINIVNYRAYMYSYKNILYDLVPLADTISGGKSVGNKMGEKFQTELYPTITKDVAGLAGTFWGECLINGGFVLLILMLNMLCFFMYFLNNNLLKRSPMYQSIGFIFLIYLSFYIHRLYLSDILDLIKFLTFIVILKIMFERIIQPYFISLMRKVKNYGN